jgi:hypothetical protein
MASVVSVLLWSRLMPSRRPAAALSAILCAIFFACFSFAQPASSVAKKGAAPGATGTPLFLRIDEFTAALSEITGWPVHKKVPSEIITKAKFQQYLQAHTRDKSSLREIHAEELSLKMLGLVPADFNLARETEDLLGEQAAAFYDYKKKRLYILDSTPEGDDQRMALVHELAHALADQQHPLGKYLDENSDNSDQTTAHEAVMEGQATWLTWAYEAKRVGRKAEVPPGMIDELTQSEDSGPDFPVLSAAPLYMRESLLFPYNAGARFQDAVYRSLGRQAFDSVFVNGPTSTHQIMHPGAYLGQKTPKDSPEVKGPSYERLLASYEPAPPPHELRGLIESSMGEFDHAVLLEQYVGKPEGPAAAAHLRGGGFRLYEHKKEKYPVLAYWSEWDSPESARVYFRMYQKILKGKGKKMTITSTAPNQITGTGDSGQFLLRITDRTVQSLEGLK